MNQNSVRIINLALWTFASIIIVILKKAEILSDLFWFYQSLCFANIIIISSSFISYRVPGEWTLELQITGVLFSTVYNAIVFIWLFKLISSVDENYFIFINNMDNFNLLMGGFMFFTLKMIHDMPPRQNNWCVWLNFAIWFLSFAILEFRIITLGPPIKSGFPTKAVHEMFYSILLIYISYLGFIISSFFSNFQLPEVRRSLFRIILTFIIIAFNAIFIINFASLTYDRSWRMFSQAELKYYLCIMTMFLGIISNFICDIPDV
jgi:hypothetical protein